VRSLILLSILAVTSAQIIDRDIRLGSRVDRQTDYTHQRDFVDTLTHAPGGWNSQFNQDPGDAMLVVYQMPADGIIKGVNVPIQEWGTGDQQITVGLYRVTYPFRDDDSQYPVTAVDAAGWIGGYDMDADGRMTFVGTTYSAAGTQGICDTGDVVADGVQDPLGDVASTLGPIGIPKMGLAWPDGFLAATLDPTNNPDIGVMGGGDNWINTVDFGTEPTYLSGEYVGILVYSSGAGGGDAPETGFQYQAGGPLGMNNPWVSLKFYGSTEADGLCGGTSGNDGWHIRNWIFRFELAVLLTGDRAPVLSDADILPTTLSTAARDLSVVATDDNPSGGAAGVASVEVFYSVDEGAFTAVTLTADADTFSGQIPGQVAGSTIDYYYLATDVLDNETESPTYTYNIFAPVKQNLFFYNSSNFASWVQDYYLNATGMQADYWSFGVGTTVLFDNYDFVVEMTGGGPDYSNNASIRAWIEAGGDYILAGDEWLGAHTGWEDSTYVAGSFQYDILGILSDHNDIPGGRAGISRLLTVADDPISGLLHTFLADSSLDLNYDPVYEIGVANQLDGVTPQTGVSVAFNCLSGELDSLNNPPVDADEYAAGIYQTLSGGAKVVFLTFDPLATNTTPDYHWIGIYPEGPLQGAVAWVDPVLSVEKDANIPSSFALHGNYPNPFNPSTNIAFSLNAISDVTVKVFSILGQEVATIHSGELNSGLQTISWNGIDNAGKLVSTGVYFYRVEANNQALTGKMMLLK